MRVLLNVPLSPYSGYGNDGLGMARAFVQMGADVYLAPAAAQPPLPKDIAALLTKEPAERFDLYISHLDPSLINCSAILAERATVTVGWTMWEYTSFANLKNADTLRTRLSGFDTLIGYDPVSTGALAEHFDGELLTHQGGFDAENWKPVERNWYSDEFYFCMNGMLSDRKDPFKAISAFLGLCEEHEDFNAHARLSLKTAPQSQIHPKVAEQHRNIRIYFETWSNETLHTFYQSQHCLLAPSRGEGKNLPALEFMSTGGAVIATNWGGHTQWLDPAYSYPLDYTLVPAQADGRRTTALHADASLEHLKAQMLHVFRNRDDAEEKGEKAARFIPQMLDWDQVVEDLLFKLEDR